MKEYPTPTLLCGTVPNWVPRTPGSLVVTYDAPAVALRKQQIQERAKAGPRIDLTGQRAGKLTIERRDPKRGRSNWRCTCDCGRSVSRQQDSLRRSPNADCGRGCPLRGKT